MTQAQQLANLSQAFTAGGLMFRNLLINPCGRINQRGYASGAATSGANQYTLDRWRVVTSGQNLTVAITNNILTFTAPAGGVEQVIEGANIEGGTYCLAWTGTATATINGNAVANGGNFTLPANTNATVRFSGGTFYQPQLELGARPTPFERRPIGMELALCQRYYEAGEFGAVYYAGVTLTAIMHLCRYKVTKRTSPTVAFSNVQYYNAGQPTAISTNISTTGASVDGVSIYINGGMTNCNGIVGGNFTANAEL